MKTYSGDKSSDSMNFGTESFSFGLTWNCRKRDAGLSHKGIHSDKASDSVRFGTESFSFG